MAGMNGNCNFGQQGVRQAQNTEGLKSNLESVDGKTKKTREEHLDKAVWNFGSEGSGGAKPGDVIVARDENGYVYYKIDENGVGQKCSKEDMCDALEMTRGDIRKPLTLPKHHT